MDRSLGDVKVLIYDTNKPKGEKQITHLHSLRFLEGTKVLTKPRKFQICSNQWVSVSPHLFRRKIQPGIGRSMVKTSDEHLNSIVTISFWGLGIYIPTTHSSFADDLTLDKHLLEL